MKMFEVQQGMGDKCLDGNPDGIAMRRPRCLLT